MTSSPIWTEPDLNKKGMRKSSRRGACSGLNNQSRRPLTFCLLFTSCRVFTRPPSASVSWLYFDSDLLISVVLPSASQTVPPPQQSRPLIRLHVAAVPAEGTNLGDTTGEGRKETLYKLGDAIRRAVDRLQDSFF